MPIIKSTGEVNELTVKEEPLVNNQKIKKGRGGPRPNSGRKPGAIQKLGGKELLEAIQKRTGKSFADNIAEHYHRAIVSEEWSDVKDYEKFIIQKVVSDVKEVDITSMGQSLVPQFNFPTKEIQDWSEE